MKVKSREVKTEKDLSETFDQMYALSKEGNEPFYNLIELMMNEQVIMTAIHNIKANKGSKTAGIDGKKMNYYLNKPFEELVELVRKSIKNYNPFPIKRKHIPKSNGKTRPLGIPIILDRIIQEVARLVIEPILEAKFYIHSYGYRPYRKASHAMAEILDRLTRSKTYWVIEGDIKGFFDNINQNKMVEILWNLGIKDKRLLTIIKKMLKSGVIEEDKRLYPTDIGTPQGGIISPLLANAYLNYFDWMIAKEYMQHPYTQNSSYKSDSSLRRLRKNNRETFIVRYADDWVILCTKENAERLLNKVRKYFSNNLKLELSEEKTLITDVRENRAKFLGFEFFVEKSRGKGKLVGKLIPNIQRTNAKIAEINKEIRKLRLRVDYHGDRALQIENINQKIIGVTEYYKYANCSNFFKSWDNRIYYQQWKSIRYLNGKKGSLKQLTSSSAELDNRRARHKERKDRLFFLEIDNVKMGITKFSMTASANALRINHKMTPFTDKGRVIYQRSADKKLPLLRLGTIYDFESLKKLKLNGFSSTTHKFRLTFEYFMNREYAYLRDRGKCSCCKVELWKNYECHHKNSKLPLDKINKVGNLTSLCKRCHSLVHSDKDISSILPYTAAKKLLKLRELYTA